MPCLARRDVAFLAEQVVELVDAIQQAVARESLDWEGDTASVRQSEDLGLEIDVVLVSEELTERFLCPSSDYLRQMAA